MKICAKTEACQRPDRHSGVCMKPIVCGTYSGYQLHKRRKEPVDDACRRAATEYTRRYRADGRDEWLNTKAGTCVRGLGWPR